MLNVTKELTALARKLGYTGKAPDTVAKAINAITSVAGSSGGGGEVFIIEVEKTESASTLNKTWKEVKDAFISGDICIIVEPSSEVTNRFMVISVTDVHNDIIGDEYVVAINGTEQTYSFATNSENGYPLIVEL